MPQKVIRTGNSAAVTIPAKFVRDLGIRIGDPVKVRLEKDKGRAIYAFSGAKQLLLSENFPSPRKKKGQRDLIQTRGDELLDTFSKSINDTVSV